MNIDLSQWKKKKEILQQLKAQGSPMNERAFRRAIQNHNNLFSAGLVDSYIVHDNRRGYKESRDYNEIMRSLRDKRRRANTMLKEARKAEMQLGIAAGDLLEDADD